MTTKNKSTKNKPNYIIGSAWAQAIAKDSARASNIIYIVDEQVKKHFQASAQALHTAKIIYVRAGEDLKSMTRVAQWVRRLMKLDADRNSIIVAVGGGALLDMIGFVASVYMRGVRVAYVPTTLLAQVDAAMGGKTAVNVGAHKNIIGTFSFPFLIAWDAQFLHSQPIALWRDGMVEVIKHAAVFDTDLWKLLGAHTIKDFQKNDALLTEMLAYNIRIKTHVVEQDPYEKAERKLLNFGHTLAHAVERVEGFSHGKAVAIGMRAAARWSEKYANAPKDTEQKIVDMLARYEMKTNYKIHKEKVRTLMLHDKKRSKNTLTLALVKRIGEGVRYDFPTDHIDELLK